MPFFAEDRRIDFKRGERIGWDELATFLSMYSNSPDGGVIVYGADSKGNPTGCSSLSPRQLNEIEKCHLNRCPSARPEFKRFAVTVNGQEDFCIAIYIPYIGKLCETSADEAFIRYGDSKHKMSDDEKRDFRSSRQELSWEQEKATAYKFPADFDLRLVQDFCDAFRELESRKDWDNQDVLLDRHLGHLVDGDFVPTNALVLLAAKDPRRTIPGSRIRMQRFQGIAEGTGENYNPVRDKYAEGNLVTMLKAAASSIDDIMHNVTWLNADGKFVTTPEYPRWAWFEALVNACVHRSYSFSGTEISIKLFDDRMEVESPGGFVPPVNESTIYVTRAARNPHLMDALRVLGYVRMAREGTRRIRESMKEWQLPEPIFRQEAVNGVVVKVTLMNDHATRKRATDADVASFFGVDMWRRLSEHEIQIAAHVFRNETVQVSEAQRLTGRTWGTSKKDLDRLVNKGVLEFVPGEYTRDPKAHYRLKPRS